MIESLHLVVPTDPRLKRHVVHDSRSRQYALTPGMAPTDRVEWQRHGPILDQGDLGSCTANAALGLLMTDPFSDGTQYTEDDARQLYREETRLDDREIPGHWEPYDTGSAGIYAMKALRDRGLISAYYHAFSAAAALYALHRGPIAMGSLWLESMFEPNRSGVLVVDKRSREAGGHEYVIDGWDPRGYVRMTNSWGESWGQDGSAWIAYSDFVWLMRQWGDVVQPSL